MIARNRLYWRVVVFFLVKDFRDKPLLGQLAQEGIILDSLWLGFAMVLNFHREFLCVIEGVIFRYGIYDGIAILWCYCDDAHGQLLEWCILEMLGVQHLLQVAAWILDDALFFSDLADADPGEKQGAPYLCSFVSPAIDGQNDAAAGIVPRTHFTKIKRAAMYLKRTLRQILYHDKGNSPSEFCSEWPDPISWLPIRMVYGIME